MAVKPTQIKAKQVYAYVGSTPTRRVQSFDYASNFTIDSVYELGNAGIVEDAITLVETAITLNSNEWGTTDLEAMVFGIYEQRNALKSPNNTAGTIIVASKGAGGAWANVAADSWLQVMRFNAYPTTNAAEYVRVDAVTYAGGSIEIGLDPLYELAAPATGGDVVSLVNAYTITQDTVDAKPVHFVLPYRRSTSATTMMNSVLLPRCFADSFTYRIDTGGAAEQNYSLVGEEERLLLGSRRECQVITGSFMSYSSTDCVFRVPQDSLAVTGSPYLAYADSNLATAGAITHISGQMTMQVTFGSGLGIDSSSQLQLYYTNMTKKGYKGLTNLDSGIGKLTKGYVEVWMQTGSGTNEKLSRVTGVDINHPLTRESIDELGESRTIGKPLEGNLRNELTLTFNKNDLREYAKLLGYQEAFDAGTLTELLMTDLKSVKNITITLKFYNSQTTHDATTLLKTMTYSNCNFIGDSTTTPISGASGLELQFSSQSISIVGSGLPPIYA